VRARVRVRVRVRVCSVAPPKHEPVERRAAVG